MSDFEQLGDASRALADGRLASLREAAVTQFLERGLPSLRDEDWKYTDLSDAATVLSSALAATRPQAATPVAAPGEIDAHWIIIDNGVPSIDALSGIDGLAVSLLSDSDAEISYALPLADLNLALLNDGVHIRVSRNASIDKPVGILFSDRTTNADSASQGRVIVELAAGADLELVEVHESNGAGRVFANNVVEFKLGDAASLRHTRLQRRARHHLHTLSTNVALGRDAQFRHLSVDTGGLMVRNDLNVDLAQPGADARFDGLYFADAGQHIDNHTRVDHRVGPASSSQEYRGIVRGRAVWNGKAVVHEGADGTDAQQSNHNLLLADRAEINAKPELEIYAEDVKCSHGTTVGQLDDTALFYLRSRGLDTEQARQLMTQAFALGVLADNPVSASDEIARRLVEESLDAMIRQEAGA